MADYSDPKRATAYRFTMSLYARSDNQIKVTPTLAAGDVKVSKDNGATANITTLPAETPASSGILQVDLSATEMTADLVTIIFRDAAGAEWNDVAVHLAPGVRQMADLAYPATSGRSMVVDANGLVDANTVKVGPTGAGTAQTAGDIMADTNDIQTRLPAALVSGRMDVSVGAMAANVVTAAAIADGAIDNATLAADTGLKSIRSGTAQAGAASTITLDASASAVDNFYRYALIVITGGTGSGQARHIASYVGATKVATVNASWITNPDATSTFAILPYSLTPADVLRWNSTAVATPTTAGVPAVEVIDMSAAGQTDVRAAVGLASANLDTQLSTIDDFLDTEVAAILAAVDTEVASILSTVATNLDATVSSRLATASYTAPLDAAGTRTAVGLASANLDTQLADLPTNAELATALGTADDAVLAAIATTDGKVDAVKAKTDSLNFTVAGQVDSNIQYVNDVQVNGTGAAGSEWGP